MQRVAVKLEQSPAPEKVGRRLAQAKHAFGLAWCRGLRVECDALLVEVDKVKAEVVTIASSIMDLYILPRLD